MFSRLAMRRRLIVVAIAITGIALTPGPAAAKSTWDAITDVVVIIADTVLGNLTARQEKEMIEDVWDEWCGQREAEARTHVGQVSTDGFYPVAEYTPAGLGTTTALRYFFIDPATGEPPTGECPTPPFEVSAVRYEALLELPTLNKEALTVELIRQNLTLLGTSTDAWNDFALDFTLQGFEPIVLGFPLDAGGNEITGEGTAGFASHVLVPEPGALPLMLSGIGALWAMNRRRRRPA